MNKPKENSVERFRRLYPELSEAELAIARENFRRYVELVLRIYEAICADPDRYAQFKALTAERCEATLKSQSPN